MTADISFKQVKYKRGQNPASQKNLKPFKPGENGVKPGQGYSLKAELKHALDKEARAKLIKSTIEGAILREPTPFKEVWDRVEGRLQDYIPPLSQDNRITNIFVIDGETKELIGMVKDRTAKLLEPLSEATGEEYGVL